MDEVFNKIEILGNRIIVKLIEYSEDSEVNEHGVIVTDYSITPQDGKINFSLNPYKYSTVGTIVAMSEYAKESLKDLKMDLDIGDVVWISKSGTDESNTFNVNRDTVVPGDSPYRAIVPQHIEAKVK